MLQFRIVMMDARWISLACQKLKSPDSATLQKLGLGRRISLDSLRQCGPVFMAILPVIFLPAYPWDVEDHVLGSHFIDKISRPVTRLSNIGPATCSMPGHRLQDGEVWFVQQSVFSSGIPMLPLLFEQVMSSASASYAD